VILTFAAPDGPVALSVDDARLAGPLGRLFPTHANGGPACPATASVAVAVRTTPEGFTIDAGGARASCRSFADLLGSVEFALSEALLARSSGHVRLHAAGAEVRGRAVLALGSGGAGKSTLAYAWQHRGFLAYGDDVVLVDRAGTVQPFPRLFKLDPAAIEAMGGDVETTPFWEFGWDEAWFDPAAAAGWGAPARPAVVAVVRYRDGAPYRARALRRHEVLAALLSSRVPPVGTPEQDVATLASVTEAAVGLEVEFGNACEAARRLAEEVG